MENATKAPFTMDDLKGLQYLGRYRNNWRRRWVELWRLDAGHVLSVGRLDDGRTIGPFLESNQDHWRALDAFTWGRTYVAE